MEYILIAWFSLTGFDTNTGNSAYAYGYGLATSISQEFHSKEACENAGQTLRKASVDTDTVYRMGKRATAKWNWICVPKGEAEIPKPESD